jgi:hypothetical protein
MMRISLRDTVFTEAEKTFLDWDGLKVSLFSYRTGIRAARLENREGQATILPFRGQQLWDVSFHGRQLRMRSLYDAPRVADHFLDTYGCFMMHCGALKMGCPGPEDDHPLHGELPYALYDDAWIVAGEDEGGRYIGVSGTFEYNRAFSDAYVARPCVTLHEGSTVLDIEMRIDNMSSYPMELMYMCHINFLPVVGGRIVQSAEWSPEAMVLRTSIPEHLRVSRNFLDFLERLKKDPGLTETIREEDEYNPEICFFIESPKVDSEGWSHYLQVHPDGHAGYVSYMPEELDRNTRWIVRTKNQEALDIALPATCDPEGYTEEKKKGHLKAIDGGGEVSFHIKTGFLDKSQAAGMEKKIQSL